MSNPSSFESFIDDAFRQAIQYRVIRENARGVIALNDLITAVDRNDSEWQVEVANELKAWEEDQFSLEQTAVRLRDKYFRGPATMIDRLWWIFLSESDRAAHINDKVVIDPEYRSA